MDRGLLLRIKDVDLGWISFKSSNHATLNTICNGETIKHDGKSITYYSQTRLSSFIKTKMCSSNKNSKLYNHASTALPLPKCIDK